MAYEAAQIKLGNLVAASDLSTKQFYFVKLASATTVDVCTAITDKPIGVLQNTPSSGQAAEICIFGITKVSADGNLSAGNLIGTSSDSQADAIASGTDTTVYVMGQAIEAGAAGNIVTMFLNPSNSRAV
jgi:hypothetical protein